MLLQSCFLSHLPFSFKFLERGILVFSVHFPCFPFTHGPILIYLLSLSWHGTIFVFSRKSDSMDPLFRVSLDLWLSIIHLCLASVTSDSLLLMAIHFVSEKKILCRYLLIWEWGREKERKKQSRDREIERELFLPWVHTPIGRSGPGQSQELHLGLSCGWQGPSTRIPFHCLLKHMNNNLCWKQKELGLSWGSDEEY